MDRRLNRRRYRAASEPPEPHSELSVGITSSHPLVRIPVEQADSSQSIASGAGGPPPPPPPPPPFGTDLGEFMRLFLVGLAQVAGHGAGTGRALGDPFTTAHRDFTHLHTLYFDGCGTYTITEDWVTAVQETLRLARSPAEFHTELAATLFDGDARHWWTTQQPQYEYDPNILWRWFTDAFRARFMGQAQLRALR